MLAPANSRRPTVKRFVLAFAACAASLILSDGSARAQYYMKSTSWGSSASSSWSRGYGPNGSYNTSQQNSNWYRNASQSQVGFTPYGYGSAGYNVNTGGYRSSSQGQGYGPSGYWNYSNGNRGNYQNGNIWYRGW